MEVNRIYNEDCLIGMDKIPDKSINLILTDLPYNITAAVVGKDDQEVPHVECPVCRRKTLARKYSPKTKKHFWVCEEKSCVHPTTGKTVFYADSRKKPVVKLCPQCGVPLCHVYSKKTKQQYWVCPKCNEFKKML